MRALALLFVVACSSAPSRTTAPAATPCLADEITTLKWQLPDSACVAADRCAKDCDAKVANGCFLEAQRAEQRNDSSRALAGYARACKLGMSLGCTNWGAMTWVPSDTPTKELCAKRVFEAACRVRDAWACGMHGRFLAVAARTDEERSTARSYFDGLCNDIGDVTCRMYGFHLESEQLGTWSPALVKALMIRACETGDVDACGAETAKETFR
jgi:hypothetical protein